MLDFWIQFCLKISKAAEAWWDLNQRQEFAAEEEEFTIFIQTQKNQSSSTFNGPMLYFIHSQW